METPSPSDIIYRAVFWLILLVAIVCGYSFIKKKQRQSAIIVELESITSDSSFFQQFYPEDARKTLIRAIGLIAEANSLGLTPDTTISRGMGIKTELFASTANREEPPVREKIIRACLRSNYENFVKLGYKADIRTLDTMKNGALPVIPVGPQSGRNPVIANLISATLSPGMEKVIANLELRPPQADQTPPTAIEIAAAKQLACALSEARFIEEPVRDHILESLSSKPEP
jgi:hypothetical protein